MPAAPVAPPAPAIIAAPEAPAAAPAAPAAPPVGSSTPPEIRESGGAEAFEVLEGLGTDDGKPEVAPEAEKPTAGKPRDEKGKFAEKPAEKPATEKPATPAPPEKLAPKQLREAYEALQEKHKALEAEHTALKSKPTTPPDDTEKKALAEKLSAREKRLQEIEQELRFSDYTKSEEYKEKFEQPFVDAYLTGRARVAAMKTAAREDEVTGETTESRQATAEDFDTLMKISDDDAAAEWAAKMFGSKAPSVLYHRERVQELNQARDKAVSEYRKNGSEREKKRAADQETFVKSFQEEVSKHSQLAIEKFPQWFKPADDDPKGNEALERGQYLVERVLANGAPVKEGDKPMTHAELARAIAAVRQKAGAFDRLAMRAAKASKRIKELETELEQFKASGPGASDGKGGGAAGDDESIEGAQAQLEKKYSSAG